MVGCDVQKICIHNVRLLDGLGRHYPGADVFLEGDRISDVRTPSGSAPVDREIIRGDGCTLMPGLIDGHVHLTFDSSPRAPLFAVGKSREEVVEQALNWARQHIRAGVTTIRELAGTVKAEFSIRDALSDYDDVPRIYDCIGTMTSPDGFGLQVAVPLTERNAAFMIDKLAGKADHLKILGDRYDDESPDGFALHFDNETFSEICRAAWDAKVPVVVHAKARGVILQCIANGVHCIEHGIDLRDDDLQQLVDSGIFLEATFWGLKHRADAQPGFDEFERIKSIYKRAHDDGVRLTLGSDSGAVYTPHAGAPRELVYMVEAGLSPLDAVTAATSTGAQLVGNDLIGAVAPGKKADLLLLSEDPLRDINAVANNLIWVMKDGRIVHETRGE